MKTKYPHIFEPMTIRRMTVKNRIVMTPMGTNYGEHTPGSRIWWGSVGGSWR